MIPGRAGLSSFDAALNQAGQATATLTAELQAMNQRVMDLRAEAAGAYRELATLKLRDAGGASAVAELDAAADAVGRLVAARATTLAEAEARLAAAQAEAAASARARDAAAAALDQLEDAAEAAGAAARTRLSDDPAWRQAQAAAEAAGAVALRAEQKQALAAGDRAEKGRPYEADPLFMYLWQRGFGTQAYRAGPISRLLDGWVAKVARYEPARRNFALLTSLPDRLAGHAAHTRALAAEAEAARTTIEQRAAEAAGGPEAAALSRARADFTAAEDKAEAAQEALHEAQARLARMASGQDEDAQAATDQVEAALRREDLASLRAAAARTPSPEDDALVLRIERLESERWRLSQEMTARRQALDQARAQAQQAEGLRREYRQRGYDTGRLDMGTGAMLGILLGQVLSGGLRRDTFFDRLETSRGADPWRSGGPSPWGGGRAPGGFRTGGQMGGGGSGGGGGGGFKTGGGF